MTWTDTAIYVLAGWGFGRIVADLVILATDHFWPVR